MSGENYKLLDRDHLIRLAEVGIAEAQDEIGYRILRDNVGDDSKLEEAAQWFTLAADQGNLNGMFNLASMYRMGIGVETNYDKAFELYKRSADQGFSISKYFLSEMYKKGLGTEKNEQKALQLVAESFSEEILITN